MYADLHLHSTFSDGTDTPVGLCELAMRHDVKVISLTDHDSVEGYNELCKTNVSSSLRIIPGIEISSMHNRNLLHILGYYIDVHSNILHEFLMRMAAEKTYNTRINFENALAKKVFAYDWERVVELNVDQPRLSGVHVVKAMQIDKYEVPGLGLWDMFYLHFRPEGREFIDTNVASGYEAIDVIKSIGGVPVIAHPKSIQDDVKVLDLLAYGALGLEAYHPSHTRDEIEKYLNMATTEKCMVTGGSDWHGKNSGADTPHFAATGLMHANYKILSYA